MDLRKTIKILLLVLFMCYFNTLQTVYADEIAETESPKSPMKVEVIEDSSEGVADTVEQTVDTASSKIERSIQEEESHWKPLGDCRITYYCPVCNDPGYSYASSSGTTLYEGCVACSWLPLGSKIRINGDEYVVVDRCGTDAIDIFVDTDSCYCSQYGTYYAEVEVYQNGR